MEKTKFLSRARSVTGLAMLGAALMLAALPSVQAKGSHTVRGHVTKKGTYVPPHHATNPNKSKHDNWSSKGNVNPHTGKEGTKDPNAPKKP